MSALEQSDTTVRSNGAPPEQAGRIAVHNPATGEVIGQVDDMSPAQVEAVVERARRRARPRRGKRLRYASARRRPVRAAFLGDPRIAERILDATSPRTGQTHEEQPCWRI